MFNNQENSFLQAIQKMLSSTNNDDRIKAEQDIHLWAKESYLQILQACNKFIICEELDINSRRYSSYLMEILINEENYENWENLDPNLKNNIKINSLSLLGNKVKEIRLSGSTLVSSIEKVCIKNNEWPNLITILCQACDSNEIEFKLSSIKTLGFIWESINKENFSKDELILMENTIIKVLLSSNSLDLSYESLGAYQYFIKYIYDNYQNAEYLQSSLQMLANYCNLQKYNEKIAKRAIHRIADVVITAYDYMESNIKNILEFFSVICNGENELLALQSYIFLIELSRIEFNRIKKNVECHNYIYSNWNIIWPTIRNTLNTTINPAYNDEENRYKSLSSLLYYISKICKEDIIDDVFLYMKDKMKEQNPLMINSAIYAFASILEAPHTTKIEKVIYTSINFLYDYMNIRCEELNKTVSWCFEKICEHYGGKIIKNPHAFKLIITMISNTLKKTDIHPKVKIYLCTSLLHLSQCLKVLEHSKLNIFSPYLMDLLKTLDYLAYLPSSFDANNNVSRYCFIAISGLIKSSQESDEEILSLFFEKVMERFSQANNINNFINKESQYQTQACLCMVLESFCNVKIKVKFTYKTIEFLYNNIELFFKQRGIFEEGLQALSKLSFSISNKEYSQIMGVIMEHIFDCLKDYQDFSNCKTALLCLIDLITTSKENFASYIERIINYFQEIIKKPDANKELFSYFLIIYSDLFEFLGESIWEYVQIPLEYMKYILNFCMNNYDKYISEEAEYEDYNYFLILNDNVMDLIENIVKRINKENKERKQAFFEYATNIVYYLNFMFEKNNFRPNKDFILSCLSILFDLIDIYNENILNLINHNTTRRLSILSEETNDFQLFNLNKSLQEYISSCQYNFLLNQDDFF